MSHPDHPGIQTVKDVYRAFKRGDVEAILAALADDVDWQVHGPEVIPFAGRWKGRDEVLKFFEIVARTVERDADELDPEAFEYLGHGDQVVAIGTDRFRARSTGATIEGWWVHVFSIEDGRIRRFREFFDTHACASAFLATAASEAAE